MDPREDQQTSLPPVTFLVETSRGLFLGTDPPTGLVRRFVNFLSARERRERREEED